MTLIRIFRLAACVLLLPGVSPAGEPISRILRAPEQLTAAIDRVVTNRMASHHIPGAVVVLVHAGKVIFKKGYGFSNLEQGTPVHPDKTLFRVASVSKVFTAMAALKLVDQGIIGLDEDVRPRLASTGLELAVPGMGPLTLRQLLTHTAGIRETHLRDLTTTKDPARVLPLGPYLQKCEPLRWQDSGESMMYSDHGITLAGYVIEHTSRKSFQDHVHTTVLRPLGMSRTIYTASRRQRSDIAVAYSYVDKRLTPLPFEYSSIDPAIGILTTGSDMAQLIKAHLPGGRKWISSKALQYMHEPQYSDDPRLGLWFTCGFWRMLHVRDEPFLFHYGGAFGFAAQVTILPASDLGFFVAQSRGAELAFHMSDLEALLGWKTDSTNRPPASAPKPLPSEPSHLQSLTGTYVCGRDLSRRRALTTNDHVYIRYLKDLHGIELTHARHREKSLRMVEVESLFFRAVDGSQHASFRRSRDGKQLYLFDLNFTGEVQFTRISETDLSTQPQR